MSHLRLTILCRRLPRKRPHALLDLTFKELSARAAPQPWDANYTHQIRFSKRFLKLFCRLRRASKTFSKRRTQTPLRGLRDSLLIRQELRIIHFNFCL